MTLAAATARDGSSGGTLSVRRIVYAVIWLSVFLGGFVINEPAPYDLFMVLVIGLWLILGLKFAREFAPLIILMMVYIAGGILSLTQLDVINKQVVMYMAISGFLAATSIFFAAIISADPSRLKALRSGYVAAAVIAATAGVAGYFHLFPGAGIFTLYDRAKGTFEDPNVFGPFLVLGAVFIIRDILAEPTRRAGLHLVMLAVIVLAIFLSFSRASWGLFVVATLVLGLMVYANETDPKRRMRLIMLAVMGALLLTFMLLIALSIDSVSQLFEARAKLVQDYDEARLGRFARHLIGFQMAMERPLGLGPFEFGIMFNEDPHNVYLKGFLAYGWLGGLAYPLLCLLTLVRLLPIVFKRRPWQLATQCIAAVFFGHVLAGVVIDTDHWRHMYLLIGVSWGIIAADARYSAQRPKPAPPVA